jgi:hypothetical protein
MFIIIDEYNNKKQSLSDYFNPIINKILVSGWNSWQDFLISIWSRSVSLSTTDSIIDGNISL